VSSKKILLISLCALTGATLVVCLFILKPIQITVPRLSFSLSGGTRALDVELAMGLARKGEFEKARKVFEGLLLEDPKSVSVLNNLGFIAAETGAATKALEYYRAAIELSRECAECFNNMGSVKWKEGQIEEARSAFQRATEISPDYSEALLHLAVLEEQDSNFSKAVSLYERAQKHITEEKLKKWVGLRISLLSEVPFQRSLASEK